MKGSHRTAIAQAKNSGICGKLKSVDPRSTQSPGADPAHACGRRHVQDCVCLSRFVTHAITWLYGATGALYHLKIASMTVEHECAPPVVQEQNQNHVRSLKGAKTRQDPDSLASIFQGNFKWKLPGSNAK